MQSLEELNLNQNGITAEGMLELVCAFKSNPKLKTIILSGNTLKVDGAVVFAEVSDYVLLTLILSGISLLFKKLRC